MVLDKHDWQLRSFQDLQKPQIELDGKACAAVGQSGLMALYDTLFSQVTHKHEADRGEIHHKIYDLVVVFVVAARCRDFAASCY